MFYHSYAPLLNGKLNNLDRKVKRYRFYLK